MRNVEIVSSLALVFSPKDQGFDYPSMELTRLWKIVLLNQFHDVLPGSSINAVCWIVTILIFFSIGLHCFDAVGWVSGRAFGP